MNEKETALATIEEVEEELPKNLLALAISKQADPDTLSKLMDLQERWQANKAHQAYVAAMTAFKQDAPAVLKKNDVVSFTSSKGRTAYRYANLGSIVQEITATAEYEAHLKRVSKRLKRQRHDRDIAEGLEREEEDE